MGNDDTKNKKRIREEKMNDQSNKKQNNRKQNKMHDKPVSDKAHEKDKTVSNKSVVIRHVPEPTPEELARIQGYEMQEQNIAFDTNNNSEQNGTDETVIQEGELVNKEKVKKSVPSDLPDDKKKEPVISKVNTDNVKEDKADKENGSAIAIGPDNQEETTKKKIANTISLANRSARFKRIMDIALEVEKLEDEIAETRNKYKEQAEIIISLKSRIDELTDKNRKLTDNLEKSREECSRKADEISHLKSELTNRNAAIEIIKADKSESDIEYKNSLGAALKTIYKDYVELKEMGTSDDVGLALIDTFDSMIKILENKGITIKK